MALYIIVFKADSMGVVIEISVKYPGGTLELGGLNITRAQL
jgi:hypothetical protein